MSLSFDYSNALEFMTTADIDKQEQQVGKAHHWLHQRTGAGSEYAGWVDLPQRYDREEFRRIQQTAERIRSEADALVVIGIGGSYLGAKAGIRFLNHAFHNQLSKKERTAPEIYFAGQHLSPTYLQELLHILEDKSIFLNVISKSGTTTEPAIAFLFFRGLLEKKYGKEGARNRIIATTDRTKGALKQLADEEGYETFVVPDDVGGRYSVLTPVGLLPLAAAGVDISQVMQGAREASERYANPALAENEAYQYAVIRNHFYRRGKTIELLVNYEPALDEFAEWWKQLFGESEGKDGKGIFPAAVHFSTDLHSMGQYIQDGLRQLFETVIYVDEPVHDLIIPQDDHNLDGLNEIAGRSLHEVNRKAFQGTLLAHTDGQVPNLVVRIPQISPAAFGHLVYFFEKACGMSGYLLGVNPFDQPGVEAYKQNMFALLGKKGYEQKKQLLESRLK